MTKYEIREMKTGINIEVFSELVTESAREGFRHITRLVEEYKEGVNRFDLPDEALFVCLLDNRVIGVCGLNRDPYYGKGIGRVRRLYVLSEYRRHRIGEKLTQAVIHKAKVHNDKLVLKTDNSSANRFYKSLGFVEVSGDERITHYLDLNK